VPVEAVATGIVRRAVTDPMAAARVATVAAVAVKAALTVVATAVIGVNATPRAMNGLRGNVPTHKPTV